MDDTERPATVTSSSDKRVGKNESGEWSRYAQLVAFGVSSGVFFAAGLLITEAAGEFAVDVDLKPFIIPYLLIAINRFGLVTVSIGLGAALGEGALDVVEGYELDDPVGFLGYLLGFNMFGWYLHEVAGDPTRVRSLAIAATLGGFVQAAVEATAFLMFEAGVGPLGAMFSVIGNTVTHGILLGAIPLAILVQMVPSLRDRIAATR